MSTTDERDGSPLSTTRPGAADGDDIVVITEPESGRHPRRNLRIWIAAVIAGVLAAVVGGVVFRGQANHTKIRTTSTTAALTPAAVAPVPAPTIAALPRATPPTTNAVVLPFESPPAQAAPPPAPAVVTTPPPAPAPTNTPPTIAPTKNYGPSVLTWSGPHSMTVLAGTTAILAVAAHNHTDGTVTLPHPLSCAPRLDHGEICPEVVQVLAPGTSAGAQFTVDAHGIAPGHYTLTIEGVLTVAVTVKPVS